MNESGGALRAKRSKGLWRWAAGGLALGLLVGLAATLTYPETYTSRGSIRTVPSDIPERFMPAAFALDVGSLRREMVELFFKRQTFRTVILAHDLYRSERARMPMEDVLDLMARHIHFEDTQPMTVSFSYPDPILAQRVTREFLTRLVGDSLRERGAQAKLIAGFLRAESGKAAMAWEELIAKAPNVSGAAAERLALDREIAARQYRTLRERLAEAEMLVSLDERKQGPLIEINNLPSLPERPDFSKWIFLPAGAVGGLLLGLLAGLAWRFRIEAATPPQGLEDAPARK